ncbi:MAG: transposase [bacterium]|nr:transposase [bacterium]
MPQSLARILVHITFSTKNRQPLISPAVEPELHAYMAGILHKIGCAEMLVGGTTDHVHVLCALTKNMAPAKVMQDLKSGSSKWIKGFGLPFDKFQWQSGYGMFSVSASNADTVRDYIIGQKEHHRTMTFQEEFRSFCKKHGVALDERYAWD